MTLEEKQAWIEDLLSLLSRYGQYRLEAAIQESWLAPGEGFMPGANKIAQLAEQVYVPSPPAVKLLPPAEDERMTQEEWDQFKATILEKTGMDITQFKYFATPIGLKR